MPDDSGVRDSDDLARLRRWVDSGGQWRVLARAPDRASIALLRCDGGEEADRFSTDRLDVLAYLDSMTEI